MEKNERPARKKKKKSKLGFVIFLVVAFVACIVVNIVLSSDKRMETMIVRTGSEEEIIEATGYVFREQTVIKAPEGGYVYCEVAEDQRVKSGETVISIYKNEINAEANSELQQIESEINRLSANASKENAYSQDAAKIEQNIAITLRNVPRLKNKGAVGNIAVIKSDVNSLIENRRVVLGEAEPQDRSAEINALKKKRAEVEKQYNIERTVVHAPVSGAFTSGIDGFEEALSPKFLEGINGEYLRSLDERKITAEKASKVENGALIGKIVDNFGWSVAAIVPTEMVDDVYVGDRMGLRFTDIGVESVTGTVSLIKNEENKKSVIVVKCDEYVDMIYSTSRAQIQFIKERYEGFRVPVASIRMWEGKTGVYIIKNDRAKFVPVDILYNNKEWVIISEQVTVGEKTIKLYDELIIKGKDIYNDKVVR